MSKPKLAMHPGFAKCATTSLQSQCQRDDFFLCRSHGIEWLGRGFKPFNGAPPVYDVVAGASAVQQMLKESCFDSSRLYFVSAENLINHLDVVEVLQQQFLLDVAVCTVRMPLFISLSEFYFRGWLKGSIKDTIELGLSGLQLRLERKLDMLQHRFTRSVGLCPIEQKDFIADFFERCHECSLVGIERNSKHSGHRKNSSAQPCFILALNHEYLRLGARDLDPLDRRRLIRIVQEYSIETEIGDFLPEEVLIALENRALISSQVDSYLKWLSRFGCHGHKLDEVREHIEKRISLDLSKQRCPVSVQNALEEEARELLLKAGLT
jgi:hypothetical protein